MHETTKTTKMFLCPATGDKRQKQGNHFLVMKLENVAVQIF